MATPRRPFVKLPLGYVDDVLGRGVSPGAALLLMQMVTHPSKRSIPGLLRLGPAGLAESINGVSAGQVVRRLKELQRHGLIVVDDKARPQLLYILGAVQADPATSPKATVAMARQCNQLPASSSVTLDVISAIEGTLSTELLNKHWRPERGAQGTCEVTSQAPSQGLNQGPSQGQSQSPSRIPSSVDPNTATATAARRQRAWDRLPRPFAAAAAADIQEVAKIPEDKYNALVIALSVSKWVTQKMNIPPTLRRLVSDPEYRARVISGEFADMSLRWECPDCHVPHAPTADCPPPCRGCQSRHVPELDCRKLKELEAQEAEEAELLRWRGPRGETWPDLVSELGPMKAFERKRTLDLAGTPA